MNEKTQQNEQALNDKTQQDEQASLKQKEVNAPKLPRAQKTKKPKNSDGKAPAKKSARGMKARWLFFLKDRRGGFLPGSEHEALHHALFRQLKKNTSGKTAVELAHAWEIVCTPQELEKARDGLEFSDFKTQRALAENPELLNSWIQRCLKRDVECKSVLRDGGAVT